MKETLESILQFSKDTFPKTSLKTQLERFEMEYEEMVFAQSDNEYYLELSDMFIVAIRIMDFDLSEGIRCMGIVTSAAADIKKLEKAIQRKMAVNRKRKWTYDETTGQYIRVDNKGVNYENAS